MGQLTYFYFMLCAIKRGCKIKLKMAAILFTKVFPIRKFRPNSDMIVFTPNTREELKMAIASWCDDEEAAQKIYGDVSIWNVSKITDMNEVFSGTKFHGDISRWDVSNVTDMSWMFEDCTFDGDIGDWDVSNVTNMTCMFEGCRHFKCDLSEWDVSNVREMYSMFEGCRNYAECNIDHWNVFDASMLRDILG